MLMRQINPGPLIAANPRLAAVFAALVLYLGLAPASVRTPSFLELAVVILSGIEAAMFAAFAAIYRDHVAPRSGRRHLAIALIVWFSMSLATLWFYAAFTRVGIDAYARFGVPPIFGSIN